MMVYDNYFTRFGFTKAGAAKEVGLLTEQ